MDPFDFVLAENLHMSLDAIGDMSNDTFLRWRAFYTYRADLQEREAAKNG